MHSHLAFLIHPLCFLSETATSSASQLVGQLFDRRPRTTSHRNDLLKRVIEVSDQLHDTPFVVLDGGSLSCEVTPPPDSRSSPRQQCRLLLELRTHAALPTQAAAGAHNNSAGADYSALLCSPLLCSASMELQMTNSLPQRHLRRCSLFSYKAIDMTPSSLVT